MPEVARKGDKDSRGDTIIEGSSSVFAGDTASFTNVQVTLPVEYSVEFATPVIVSAGRFAAFDEPETINYTPTSYPEDVPPETDDGNVKDEVAVTEEEKDTLVTNCKNFKSPIDYNQKLSDNYTIGSLSSNALFPHRIQAQVGLSEAEILCNLQALAENIIEPLKAEFGDFRINSGFRRGSARSQHNKGMAVDAQSSSWNSAKYLEVAQWISENLPFDQLILEHSKGQWLHISYDKTKSKQRGQILTMYRGKFESGLKLYY